MACLAVTIYRRCMQWMLLNQLHCPRDLAGNEWECEVLLTHAYEVWFERRCLLNSPKGNFLLIDLQPSILMEKKPSVKEVVFSLDQKYFCVFLSELDGREGWGGNHLLLCRGQSLLGVGVGVGERNFLNYIISYDFREPGDQKLSMMTE